MASATVDVQFKSSPFGGQTDDSGKVIFALENTSSNFTVKATSQPDYKLEVSFENIVDISSLDLGWAHEGKISFTLTGSDGDYTVSHDISD